MSPLNSLFAIILASTTTQDKVISGLERCYAPHCICPVDVPWEPTPIELIQQTTVYEIEFQENSWSISDEALKGLKGFIKSIPKQSVVTISGHTDGCGDHSHNSALSMKRIESVAQQFFGSGLVVKWKNRGESAVGHDPSARKVKIISSLQASKEIDLKGLQADVYLVDSSGSMSGEYEKWMKLIAAARPRNSRVFLSRSPYCVSGDWRNTRPDGGTEIWYSYWSIMDLMKPGQKLIIISDFNANYPLTPQEAWRIEEKVANLGLKIVAIDL